MGNDASKTNPRDVLVDESKQADIENLGDCLRALGDGQSLGDFSLTIVLYGRSKAELEQLGAEFSGIFTNADGNLFSETYNQTLTFGIPKDTREECFNVRQSGGRQGIPLLLSRGYVPRQQF
jgi:hypothetical protein